MKHTYGVKPQLKVPHVEKMPLFKILQGSGSFMRFKQNQVSSWIVFSLKVRATWRLGLHSETQTNVLEKHGPI